MSRENVEIVRRSFEAFNARDLDGLLSLSAEDCEWVPLRAQLEGTVYKGYLGIQQFLGDMDDDWEAFRIDPVEFHEQGDRVAVTGRVTALGQSGVEIDSIAGFVSPMVGAESGKIGYGAEGQRIRVKESWVPPAGCTGPALVIARTLQRYGAYLGDNSGSGSSLKMEQGTTLPGLTPDALKPCVTWNDFEYLEPGWGA